MGAFIASPSAFAAYLAAMRPDIGLAPLVGDRFDQAKSELHWLEYSMAGAATVATRIPNGGPFDPIRHGVDGLVVDRPSDWFDALRELVGSRSLREDLAGRARERVLAEYTVKARAPEWADAYRWAAEHAGHRVEGRVHGLGALAPQQLEAEAKASLRHRRDLRAADPATPGRLLAVRAGRESCASLDPQPLVTVIIPVIDEPSEVVGRAVTSVLCGSWPSVEVLVVSGAGSETPLSPEGAFSADHIEVMLSIAIESEIEFIYGQAVIEAPDAPIILGFWPPSAATCLPLGTELFAAPLVDVVTFDGEAWRDGDTPGWAFWRGVATAGARIASIEYPVTNLAVEGSGSNGQSSGGLAPADSSQSQATAFAPRLAGVVSRRGRSRR